MVTPDSADGVHILVCTRASGCSESCHSSLSSGAVVLSSPDQAGGDGQHFDGTYLVQLHSESLHGALV
jgi:hypothetical protein